MAGMPVDTIRQIHCLMLRNYLTIAIRNLMKYKGYRFIIIAVPLGW